MLLKGDLERAYQIYGEHPEYVRGQMVRKTVGRGKVDESLKIVQKSQKLYTDVIYVDTKMFLVTVTEPLNLTLQSKVENESCGHGGTCQIQCTPTLIVHSEL
jgi:hypothetical protein